MDTLRSAAALLLLGLGLGCAVPIHVETFPDADQVPLRRIAVVPVDLDLPASADRGPADYLGARLFEDLVNESPFEVIPPTEVGRVLRPGGTLVVAPRADELGPLLGRTFGIDAILYGHILRYSQRVGGARGSERPAAVWFELELRTPDGLILWKGTYNETQQPLSDDLMSFRRVMQRRFRFVSADALAAYGARKLVRELSELGERWN
jgi:hypothetical protein